MHEIGEVLIVKTNGSVEHRDSKHCVCVSLSKNFVFLINEHQTPWDGVEIKLTPKNKHWLDKTRYIGCRNIFDLGKFEIIKRAGKIDFSTLRLIRSKLDSYSDLDHKLVLQEIEQYIFEN
jgi:hypothetical protein